MKHDRGTINAKLRAANTGRGTFQEFSQEIEAFYEELQQLDVTHWCFDKGYGKMYAIVIEEFRKEILGENKT